MQLLIWFFCKKMINNEIKKFKIITYQIHFNTKFLHLLNFLKRK